MSDFDWDEIEGDLICQTVGAIAVYENSSHDLVVRQKSTNSYDDEDSFVVVPRDKVLALIHKLKLEIGLTEGNKNV